MKEFRIVALGDSLTYGYGVSSQVAYPMRLEQELTKKRPELTWKVYNRGINGETAGTAKLRLEGGVLRLKPHICTILLGSNDSLLKGDSAKIEYEQNLRYMIERLMAKKHKDKYNHGRCLPILIMLSPEANAETFPFSTVDRMEAYRRIILKLAEEYHIPLVDAFKAFMDIYELKGSDAYKNLFQTDGIHWSDQGYDIFYSLLEKNILGLIDSLMDI